MKEVVIVSGVRTPIGAYCGMLREIPVESLASLVLNEAIKRAGVKPEEVNDVIGEVSNMVGGHLKSRFCDSGFPCDLSIPSITSGKNFKIESKNWARHERIAFCHEAHVALVEVFIKASN